MDGGHGFGNKLVRLNYETDRLLLDTPSVPADRAHYHPTTTTADP